MVHPDVRRVLDGASILTKRRGPGELFEELVFTHCLAFSPDGRGDSGGW
jgi:hypothetical protein